jgi:outer membrane protein
MSKRSILFAAVVCIVAMAIPAYAADDGKWMMRSRAIYIGPDASADGDLEGIDVDSQFTFELDFTRFFTENLALELVLATASHDVTVPSDGDQSLGSVDLLPPTLVAQWHFMPDGKFKPYVGVGLNATFFYNSTGALQDLDFDDSFSYAGDVGLDVAFGERMYFNVDLKYVAIETDVEFEGDQLGTVTIDPFIFGVGLGVRF